MIEGSIHAALTICAIRRFISRILLAALPEIKSRVGDSPIRLSRLALTNRMIEQVQNRIRIACARASRDAREILLLAVSKQQSLDALRKMYHAGLRDFAENRVQELLRKKDELPPDIRWHFIGHLQTNKVKYIAPFIDMIQSVDSLELAKELSRRANDRTIKILIEVNISGEVQKNGVAPNDAEALVLEIAKACPNLIVSGLMGMASFEENPEKTRPQFRALRELRDRIQERHPELKAFKELSMGMSNDFRSRDRRRRDDRAYRLCPV